MCRKGLFLILAVVILGSVIGCGIKNALPNKEVPQMHGYSKVALVFFNKKTNKECENLPALLSYSVGTELSIRCEDKSWVFDQSEKVKPVSDNMEELSVLPCDICQDLQLAATLAESLGADLIIAGMLEEPKYTKEESGKVEYEMTEVNRTGTGRYYAIHQTAILKADIEAIDPVMQKVIWDGRVIGYKKYKTRYLTGNPPEDQREERMLADVRRDLVLKVVNTLSPAMVASEELPSP